MNNNFIKKIILYISAGLILTATPISVRASEENAQISVIPEENDNAAENTDTNVSITIDTPVDNTITPLPEPADNVGITPMQATVYAATQSGLNVRSGPSTSHGKIGTLEYGQAVSVTGITADNWYQIQYSGGIGYILAEYVSNTPITNIVPAPAASPTDAVNPDNSVATPAPDTFTDTMPSDLTTEDITADIDEETGSLIGAPTIIILAVAILGVLALIGFSVYSLFKKEDYYSNDEYYEDEYYEDGQYSDDEYYEPEYYEDGQYSDNEYYEDDYYENEHSSDDAYYEDDDLQS